MASSKIRCENNLLCKDFNHIMLLLLLLDIEHVWAWMKAWIQRRYVKRLTGCMLYEAIIKAWEVVPKGFLLKLVNSMPRR